MSDAVSSVRETLGGIGSALLGAAEAVGDRVAEAFTQDMCADGSCTSAVIPAWIGGPASSHGAARGITGAMERLAMQRGARYADMLHQGRIGHVLEGAMASGKDLFVASEAGKAVTSFARRFNPNTLLPNGSRRWIPFP